MTDHEKRLFLRGMAAARGVLKRINCPERWQAPILGYQEVLADAWELDVSDLASEKERMSFEMLLADINDAVAAKHPSWTNEAGQKWVK